MSEVKPLSAEQLGLLRSLPIKVVRAHFTEKFDGLLAMVDFGATELNDEDPSGDSDIVEVIRFDTGDTLLATITNERQQAAEGERRRIDDLAHEVGAFTFESGWDSLDGPSATFNWSEPDEVCGKRLIDTLEAAANSLNKEQTNGN